MKGQCRLCLQENVDLQNSHILPKFVYKRLRPKNSKNQNPIVIRNDIASQSSWQAKTYLLCRDCETLLKKMGEDYVAENAYLTRDNFPLRQLLEVRAPHLIKGSPPNLDKVFTGDALNGIDIEKLIYFGASVLWRFSTGSTLSSVGARLTPLEENQLREYLLQSTLLPKNIAVHLVIARRPLDPSGLDYGAIALSPTGAASSSGKDIRFAVCGLIYHFFFLNEESKMHEATSLTNRVIMLSDITQLGIHKDGLAGVAASKQSTNLKNFMKNTEDAV